jgi:hypothetical protein
MASNAPQPPPPWLFRLIAKYPFLRPLLILIAAVGIISPLLVAGVSGKNIFLAAVLSLFLFVICCFLFIFAQVSQRLAELTQGIPQSLRRTVFFCLNAIVLTIVSVFVALTVLLLTSAAFAWPRELRCLFDERYCPESMTKPPRAVKDDELKVTPHFYHKKQGGLMDVMVKLDENGKKLRKRMDKWKEWLQAGAAPSDGNQQLIVLRTNAFHDDLSGTSLKLKCGLDSTVQFLDGAAFLVLERDGFVDYRQQGFDIMQNDPENRNVLMIDSFRKEEYLMIILKIAAKPGQKLFETEGSYGFTLTR